MVGIVVFENGIMEALKPYDLAGAMSIYWMRSGSYSGKSPCSRHFTRSMKYLVIYLGIGLN